MKKWKFPDKSNEIHLPSHNYDMTLCDLALDGDHGDDIKQPAESTNEKANCEDCKKILKFYKKMKL